MTSNRRSAFRVWQLSAVGVAGAGAMIGLAAAAHADTALGDAEAGGGALTIAESLGTHTVPAAYESLLEGQATIEQNALDALSSTEAIQTNADFTPLEAYFVNAADENFAGAANGLYGGVDSLVGGPSPYSEFDLYLDDYRLEDATNQLNFLDEVATYLGIGGTNTAADSASAIDPGFFADLLSSIGL